LDLSYSILSCVWCNFMAVQMKSFIRPIFERCFQVRDLSFWLTHGIGLTGVSFHFWPQYKFRRVAAIWIFGSFFTSTWNIHQFYCFWAWFDVKFYAELKNHTLWGLKYNQKPLEPKNGICLSWNFYKSCDLSINQSILCGVWNATGSHSAVLQS
jgi:hypothetical protein